MSLLPVVGIHRAWCVEYAIDTRLESLVYARFVTEVKEPALAIMQALKAGGKLKVGNKAFQIRTEAKISLHDPESGERQQSYRVGYYFPEPTRLPTGVGYEVVLLHRDAVMGDAMPGRYGYPLRFAGESDEQFRSRFLWLWSQVTALPYRPEWFASLWRLGSALGLITPLDTGGCQGWSIDPRSKRPGGQAGWEIVLQTVVQLSDQER